MADFARMLRQKWTIKGRIDLECGRCHAVGVKVLMPVEVEGHMRAIELPEATDDERFHVLMSLSLVDGDVPVEFQCEQCGNTVKYRDTTEVSSGV